MSGTYANGQFAPNTAENIGEHNFDVTATTPGARDPAYSKYLESLTGMQGRVYGEGLGALNYDQWRALVGSFPQPGTTGGTTPTTPPPVTPPGPSDPLQGLMAQAADPYGTYGQLGVANPYMNNINQRFGFNPAGLAYGVNLQQTPSWYNPGLAHPNVVYPAIKGGGTTGTTSTGIKWPT